MRSWWQAARAAAAVGIVVALAIGAPVAARAAAEPELKMAMQVIDELGERAVVVLRDPGLDRPGRQRALVELVRERFALDQMARLVLGRHWRATAPEEQATYTRLFERYVLSTYARLIDSYTDQTLEVVGAAPVKNGIVVNSRLTGSRAAAVDWRLAPSADGWRVVDVVVEGVSMLLTQRNEFASIIERQGGAIQPLLAHLEQRVAGLDLPPG